jgi:hypothetical protein
VRTDDAAAPAGSRARWSNALVDADRLAQIQASRGLRAMRFLRGDRSAAARRDEGDSVAVGLLLTAAVLTTLVAAFFTFLWAAVDLAGGNTGGSASDRHAYWFLPTGLAVVGTALALVPLRRAGGAAAAFTALAGLAAIVTLLVICPFY